jgi:hypothetical protein
MTGLISYKALWWIEELKANQYNLSLIKTQEHSGLITRIPDIKCRYLVFILNSRSKLPGDDQLLQSDKLIVRGEPQEVKSFRKIIHVYFILLNTGK